MSEPTRRERALRPIAQDQREKAREATETQSLRTSTLKVLGKEKTIVDATFTIKGRVFEFEGALFKSEEAAMKMILMLRKYSETMTEAEMCRALYGKKFSLNTDPGGKGGEGFVGLMVWSPNEKAFMAIAAPSRYGGKPSLIPRKAGDKFHWFVLDMNAPIEADTHWLKMGIYWAMKKVMGPLGAQFSQLAKKLPKSLQFESTPQAQMDRVGEVYRGAIGKMTKEEQEALHEANIARMRMQETRATGEVPRVAPNDLDGTDEEIEAMLVEQHRQLEIKRDLFNRSRAVKMGKDPFSMIEQKVKPPPLDLDEQKLTAEINTLATNVQFLALELSLRRWAALEIKAQFTDEEERLRAIRAQHATIIDDQRRALKLGLDLQATLQAIDAERRQIHAIKPTDRTGENERRLDELAAAHAQLLEYFGHITAVIETRALECERHVIGAPLDNQRLLALQEVQTQIELDQPVNTALLEGAKIPTDDLDDAVIAAIREGRVYGEAMMETLGCRLADLAQRSDPADPIQAVPARPSDRAGEDVPLLPDFADRDPANYAQLLRHKINRLTEVRRGLVDDPDDIDLIAEARTREGEIAIMRFGALVLSEQNERIYDLRARLANEIFPDNPQLASQYDRLLVGISQSVAKIADNMDKAGHLEGDFQALVEAIERGPNFGAHLAELGRLNQLLTQALAA